jgi:hypothetical protein
MMPLVAANAAPLSTAWGQALGRFIERDALWPCDRKGVAMI